MEKPRPISGVIVAILKDGKVLLTKHWDLRDWFLPGDEVKAGEPLTQSAMREANES